MIFKSLKYKKFSQKAIDRLQVKQGLFVERYESDNYNNWFYNQSSGILRLYSDNKEVYFKYIPVGSFSRNTNTWLWSWANENSVEPRKLKTLKIKEFGEEKKYKNLTNDYFEGDKFTGWELTAIAFEILKGIGTYRVVSEHLEIYFLLTDQISKEKAEEIEKELIECDVHGKIRKAFVCQHLNTEYKTGFEEAFET